MTSTHPPTSIFICTICHPGSASKMSKQAFLLLPQACLGLSCPQQPQCSPPDPLSSQVVAHGDDKEMFLKAFHTRNKIMGYDGAFLASRRLTIKVMAEIDN